MNKMRWMVFDEWIDGTDIYNYISKRIKSNLNSPNPEWITMWHSTPSKKYTKELMKWMTSTSEHLSQQKDALE